MYMLSFRRVRKFNLYHQFLDIFFIQKHNLCCPFYCAKIFIPLPSFLFVKFAFFRVNKLLGNSLQLSAAAYLSNLNRISIIHATRPLISLGV